jgi:hypothetical protein
VWLVSRSETRILEAVENVTGKLTETFLSVRYAMKAMRVESSLFTAVCMFGFCVLFVVAG